MCWQRGAAEHRQPALSVIRTAEGKDRSKLPKHCTAGREPLCPSLSFPSGSEQPPLCPPSRAGPGLLGVQSELLSNTQI